MTTSLTVDYLVTQDCAAVLLNTKRIKIRQR